MRIVSRYVVGSSIFLAMAAVNLPAGLAVAQTNASCSTAVARAKDNFFVRIINYLGAENRESAKIHIDLANRAAAADNEAECWHELRVSGLYVGLPPGTMPQDNIAEGSEGGVGQSASALPDPAVPGSGYRIREVHGY